MNNCIEWDRARYVQGYGKRWVGRKIEYAHRVAYVEHHGLTMEDIRGHLVLHSCDNPPCVNPDHLRLGTHADNIADMVQRGRRKGERSCRAKLNDVAVRVIRQLVAEGRKQRDLADAYGVSPETISHVVTRRTWEHVQ